MGSCSWCRHLLALVRSLTHTPYALVGEATRNNPSSRNQFLEEVILTGLRLMYKGGEGGAVMSHVGL